MAKNWRTIPGMIPRAEGPLSRYIFSHKFFFVRERKREGESRGERTGDYREIETSRVWEKESGRWKSERCVRVM